MSHRAFTFIGKTVFKSGNLLFFFFIIACLLSRLNSGFFFIDILGQLGFQIVIGGVILFFILLFLKRFWASVICVFICVLFSADILLSCNHCKESTIDELQIRNKIRLMTFNISYTNPVSNFENIREMILSENPDVIQFQEVSPKMLNEIKSLKSVFPYSTNLDKPLDLFDSVILSKYPLKNIKVVNNYIVKTNVILDETELTIIGTHLPAPLNSRLFNLYSDLQLKFTNAARTQTLPIANLDIAIKQMQNLKTLADNTNQNLIIMGDLNMTPTSKRFTNFLKDTNLYTYVSYKRPTFTWPAFVPSFLGIQIDHVLFSKNFKMISKKTTNHFGSDHRPLIVDLAF